MRRATFIITLLFLSNQLFTQNPTQIVKGKIIDKDTKAPLTGANVIILNSEPLIGTISDINGNFKLENIKLGRQNFKISFLGYEDKYINEILVSSGKEVYLSIELQESVTSLKGISVTAKRSKNKPLNTMATVSARAFSIEETQRYAASINDPARMAQSYAGVATTEDESNEIVIRGNSPRGILWRMEGIEIPNPNHFSNGEGASGGGISILSSDVISNSDFFTGAFPAEYGNALSGVFDLKLRNGNFDKREYAFQIGFLGAQAALEGPFSQNSEASYLFNYRYSTLTLLNKIGISIGDDVIIPKFQDLSWNINIPAKSAGRFMFFGLGGLSTMGDHADKDSSKWIYRGDHFEENENHKMGVMGLSHYYLFKNNKTYKIFTQCYRI